MRTVAPSIFQSLRWLTAAALVISGGSAFAAQTWNYTNTGKLSTICGPDVGTSDCGPGLGVSGWSTAPSTSSTAKFSSASVYDWGSGNGLGIVASGEDKNAAGPHAIDNASGTDALLLTFTKASNLSQIQLGWNGTDNRPSSTSIYRDSDLSIFAWTGDSAPNLSAMSPSGATSLTSSGWTLVGNFMDAGSLTNNLVNTASNIYSSYWLVSAYNSAYGGTADSRIDAFKLLAISASNCVGGQCPSTNQVPEPGSLALMGLALAGLVSVRRKRAAQA